MNKRVRILPYVPSELACRLTQYCAVADMTVSAFVTAAIEDRLEGTSDRAVLLRRVDRLGRAVERLHRDEQILAEAFAVFVRLWFSHTPDVADEARDAARAAAEARYRQFVEHVSEQFSGGLRFLDDLPREDVATESELDALSLAADKAGTAQHASRRSR